MKTTTQAKIAPQGEIAEKIMPGALQKPRRDKLIRREILAFNPPELGEGGDAPRLIYIDDKGNKKTCNTTKTLWVTVDGRPTPGRKLQGLEVKKEKSFFLYFDKIKGEEVAVSFTEYPDHIYSRQSGFPEGSEAIDGIEFIVDPSTGSLKVDKIPQNSNTASIVRAMKAIDAQAQLYTGQILAQDIEVLSVSGNRVSVTPPTIMSGTTGYRQLDPVAGYTGGTVGGAQILNDSGFNAGTY